MPADVIAKGKLSDLQLEAVVYGCMRHLEDMPVEEDYEDDALGGEDMKDFIEKEPEDEDDNEPMVPETPRRAGFLLGDGAGMGKGRTLAGFVLENVCRGRKKHIWISVSSDLYEDAKRDLIDIGLKRFAEDRSLLLGKASYGDLEGQFYSDERTRGKVEGGMLFSTYSTLISKTGRGKNDEGGQVKTRLDQVVEWCGGEEFDGLLMFDEVSWRTPSDRQCIASICSMPQPYSALIVPISHSLLSPLSTYIICLFPPTVSQGKECYPRCRW